MGIGMLNTERGYLDKWQMYKALLGERVGPCQLPMTEWYSRQSVSTMLNKFGKVYTKPIDTWGGHLVSLITFQAGTYVWAMQQRNVRTYQTLSDLMSEMSEIYGPHDCIVQEAAPLARYKGRPFDIRVHMQRDEGGSWNYAGDLVRVGGANAQVSNVGASDGSVHLLTDVLDDILPKTKVCRVQRKLETIGYTIADLLDSYREFNEIGIDLGVEKYGQLWLIEVNTDDALGQPSHELFAKHPDQRIYRQLRQRLEDRSLTIAKSFLEELFSTED